MGAPQENPEPLPPVPSRMSAFAANARSASGRYPGYVRSSLLNRGRNTGPGNPAFREEWAALPNQRGVSAICWLGHNSVLLRLDGRTLLLDPVLSERIGLRIPGATIGPGRLSPVPVTPDQLPTPDLVLVTHAHFDHLDRPTLRALASHRTRVLTARGTRRLIPRGFGAIHELDWNQTTDIDGLNIHALRPNHWGARTAWDRHRGYNAYTLSVPETRVLYAGDSAFTRTFDEKGPFDLGIFGIGAYDPWIHAHANPEQVWEMATGARCRTLLPVHHSTFKLSDEPLEEPLARLLAAAGRAAGEAVVVPDSQVIPATYPLVMPLSPGEIRAFGSRAGDGIP